MRKYSILLAVVLCLIVSAELRGEWEAGPPAPVAYKVIPDPPDDAERHVVVKAADRGDVWLLTGFLHGWKPDIEYDVVARVKPKHWREDLMDDRGGAWPLWHPLGVLTGNRSDHWEARKWRGSPVFVAKWLEMILALRGEPMPADAGVDGPIRMIAPDALPLTYQVVIGSHFVPEATLANFGHSPEVVEKYRYFTHLLVKYAKLMGVPIDYWEVVNEPSPPKVWEATEGGGYWQEFLMLWDTAYEAIRSADPEAKIVGPSHGGANATVGGMYSIEPFLAHCKEKGQRLDVLAWHELYQNLEPGEQQSVEPDKAHQNIEAIRELVDSKYAMLGVQEIHIDEWGEGLESTGPGTQVAFFYYMDLAGVSRAAPASYGSFLDGLLIGKPAGVYGDRAPSVMGRRIHRYEYILRTSYWVWVEYAKQEGGVRLATETDDRCVVMLASRHDEAKEVRALLARSKRDSTAPKGLPPAKVTVDFAGIPISGKAELAILKLGPDNGAMWERNLPGRTEQRIVKIVDGALALTLDSVAENQVYSIRIAPPGTRAKEKDRQLKAAPELHRLEEQHLTATGKAQKAADKGVIRISCGAPLAFVDPAGNAWFGDRQYEQGPFGYSNGGGTVDHGLLAIAGTDNPQLYSTELWAQRFYKIDLPNGKYLLRLHFAEVWPGFGPGGRVFDVAVEGKLAFKDFAAEREAGGYKRACVKEIEIEVSDGVLAIDFSAPDKDAPLINGIEVILK